MSDQLSRHEEVAWVIKNPGGKWTVGVSAIHRVGANGQTFCLHPIPAESRRIPPLVSLNVCSRCKALSARAAAYELQQEQRASA